MFLCRDAKLLTNEPLGAHFEMSLMSKRKTNEVKDTYVCNFL